MSADSPPGNEITVVIPLYNKAGFILTAVESVLSQTVADFELIVVNDASTDGSIERLSSVHDGRLRVLHRSEPGPGGYAARNLGVARANGTWIAFIDADDVWKENHLASIQSAIRSFPGADVVCCNYRITGRTDASGATTNVAITDKGPFSLSKDETLSWFADTDFLHTSAVAVRKSALQDVEGFPAGKTRRGGDSDLWLRLALHGKRFVFVPEPTAIFLQQHSEIITAPENLELPHIIARSVGRYNSHCDSAAQRASLVKLINRKTISRLRQACRSGILELRAFRHLIWHGLSRKQWRTVRRLFRRVLTGRCTR